MSFEKAVHAEGSGALPGGCGKDGTRTNTKKRTTTCANDDPPPPARSLPTRNGKTQKRNPHEKKPEGKGQMTAQRHGGNIDLSITRYIRSLLLLLARLAYFRYRHVFPCSCSIMYFLSNLASASFTAHITVGGKYRRQLLLSARPTTEYFSNRQKKNET